MRIWLLLLLGAAGGAAQSWRFEAGAIGGVPASAILRAYQSSGRFGGFTSETATRRYVAGGTVGARINSRLTLKLGVLYRRFGYDYETWSPYPVPLAFTHFRGTGASWEAPILMKWSIIHRRTFTPFVAIGATYRRLADLSETQTQYDNFYLTNPQPIRASTSDQPALLQNRNAAGPTIGAGLEIRIRRMLLSPEVRYTRWHAATLGGFGDPIRWNWQRVDVLLEIGYLL